MIRLGTVIRVMPAIWLALPLVAFASWYVTLLYASDGYAVDASAKGSMTIAFVGAVLTACASWEGSRLRRAGLSSAPSVRSRWTVAFWILLPVVLVGIVAVTAAMVVNLVRSDAGLLPDWRFVLMTTVDLVAYGTGGFAAGLLLPIAVAAPLAMVGTFIWVGFVPAMEPVWLRHLTGMFRDCCGLEQDLAPRALMASTVVDLGFVAAAAAIATPWPSWIRAGAAIGALAIAFVLAVPMVAGMTYAPVIARDTKAMHCRKSADVSVCLWPEHDARAHEVMGIVTAVHERWVAAGIRAPGLFTEADRSVAPDSALVFSLNGANFDRGNIINSLAAGLLPPFPNCGGGATGGFAFMYLQAWYDAVGGMSPSALQREWRDFLDEPDYPAPLTLVAQLEQATRAQQVDWIARVESASQQCFTWDPELIAVQP
jgi:hypothetical protein